MGTPNWVTPYRQAQLIQLWIKYGNKCLKGHTCCPEPSHYVEVIPKLKLIPTPQPVACRDRNGNPIRDNEGNTLYITSYKYVKAIENYLRVTRLYDKVEAEVIRDWAAEDREARAYERRLADRALHSLGERGALRGTFNAISRTIYADSQPLFYVEAIGLNCLTFKPFAVVKIASSLVALHVDITEAMGKLSKCKRRKVIRHKKPLPATVQEQVSETVAKAVRRYLS